MGKLVRDRIPDIIRASGRTSRVTVLAADAYRAALRAKLREEVDELLAATAPGAVVEEAADVVEVLMAIAADNGDTWADVLATADRKRAERGGFGLRLRLDGVDATDTTDPVAPLHP